MEQTLITNDTIVALSTPKGRSAVALLRLSGPNSFEITQKIWKGCNLSEAKSHTAHLGYVCNSLNDINEPIDQVLATIFKAPNTFTGENMVELGLHGSPLIARLALEALITAGARLALPGEFSQRAVANGRMSLVGAEAAADLVAATSAAARRIAMSQMRGGVERRLQQMQDDLTRLAALLELELDFSEEDVEFASRDELMQLALSIQAHLQKLQSSFQTGSAIKEGIPVAIIGPTNAGKSSLLNQLLDEDKAIVSDIHGTTRDVIEDTMEIGEYLFRFMDTAGLRDTDDPIEKIGISHSHKALSKARIIMLVCDATSPLPENLIIQADEQRAPESSLLIVLNKTDLVTHAEPDKKYETVNISAKTGEGIEHLKQRLEEIIKADEAAEGDILITNERHRLCIEAALNALTDVINQLSPDAHNLMSSTPDLIAQSVRAVISHLSELTGSALQTPALLKHIFSHFCIGK